LDALSESSPDLSTECVEDKEATHGCDIVSGTPIKYTAAMMATEYSPVLE
jgi:hypothetical protein